MGEDLPRRGAPKSPLEIEISTKENLKSPWRGPWNREFFVGERERNWVWGCSGEIKSQIIGGFMDRHTGLTDMKNQSDGSSLTDRKVVQKWTSSPLGKIWWKNEVYRFHISPRNQFW
jgi:hypothetical protein